MHNNRNHERLNDTSALKFKIGKNVCEAAQERIDFVMRTFPRVYVSFSGGKDSTVMLHLAAQSARKHGRKIGVLLVDLEAQYQLTIDHALSMFELYKDVVEPYWCCLPILLRNAVSQFELRWKCWDPKCEDIWVRKKPEFAINDDQSVIPWQCENTEFEEFTPRFGHWYAQGKLCACLVGIRADESLNRFRTVCGKKAMFEGLRWTTYMGRTLYNVYPIYDFKTQDIWTYHGKTGLPYNHLYDRMYQAGLTIHQMRICQPYGDDQRKGLWLFHLIEPETWGKVVARVNGANSGALYAQEHGNINGVGKITKPSHLTWQEFADLLLGSMPDKTREHYENKIAVFIHWWSERGYPNGIPDEGPMNTKETPSWTRIVKALLRNDYWCKGLSFTQQESGSYERYRKIMKKRREQWGL